MSHSKLVKKGQSYPVNKWNPSVKKYIKACAICGSQGYSPMISKDSTLKEVWKNDLTKILKPLSLDDLGRCKDCAIVHDKMDSKNQHTV